MYQQISSSNKYFRAGSSRTKEYRLAKTMMILVKIMIMMMMMMMINPQRRKQATAHLKSTFLPNDLTLSCFARNVTRIVNDPKLELV